MITITYISPQCLYFSTKTQQPWSAYALAKLYTRQYARDIKAPVFQNVHSVHKLFPLPESWLIQKGLKGAQGNPLQYWTGQFHEHWANRNCEVVCPWDWSFSRLVKYMSFTTPHFPANCSSTLLPLQKDVLSIKHSSVRARIYFIFKVQTKVFYCSSSGYKRRAAVHTFWETKSHLYFRRVYQLEYKDFSVFTAQSWILYQILMSVTNHVEEIEMNTRTHRITSSVGYRKLTAFLPLSPTFLCGTSRLGFTVHPLEFIEVRADLDLIGDPLFEADQDGAALGGHFDLQVLPRGRGGQARGLPVQHPVPLDKLGLPVHLETTANNTLKWTKKPNKSV